MAVILLHCFDALEFVLVMVLFAHNRRCSVQIGKCVRGVKMFVDASCVVASFL